MFMSSSSMSDWDLPNWDWLNAFMLSIPRPSIEEKEHFKILQNFKVPSIERLLSKETLCSARLWLSKG